MLGSHYRIQDLLTGDECRELGVKSNGFRYAKDGKLVEVRAVATGERRPPRRGEWYLSGAIVEAYRSPGLDHPYPIAKLVVMRRVETWEVVA